MRYRHARPLWDESEHEALAGPFRPFQRRGRRRRRRSAPEAIEEPTTALVPLSRRDQRRADRGLDVAQWGPLTAMNPHLRLQAATGFRAAVVELRPGMFLVAEVPETEVNNPIGALPLLVPVVAALRNVLSRRRKVEPLQPHRTPGNQPWWSGPEPLPTATVAGIAGCGCAGCGR